MLQQFALLIVVISLYSACAPRVRGLSGSDDDALTYTPYTPTSERTESTDSTPTTDSSATPTASIPTEIDHCDWSVDGTTGYASEHLHIGKFTLCQSRLKDTDIYVQLQSPPTDIQICLIPTYHSGSRSIYIGEPRCFYAQQQGRVYKIEMLKNRSGYTNFTITGVMMMKYKAYQFEYPYGNPSRWMLTVDAYLFCANALDQSGDDRYCQAFTKLGQYVYHQF